MGESDTAMEYDQDRIFKHLYVLLSLIDKNSLRFPRCFYLDSPKNARKNGMAVKAKQEAIVDQRQGSSFLVFPWLTKS